MIQVGIATATPPKLASRLLSLPTILYIHMIVMGNYPSPVRGQLDAGSPRQDGCDMGGAGLPRFLPMVVFARRPRKGGQC